MKQLAIALCSLLALSAAAHDACALRAADDQEREPAGRQSRILQPRRVEHGRAYRIAGLNAFASKLRIEASQIRKTRGDALHAAGKQAIGAAEHRILLVHDSRDAEHRCGKQRRHGRITAEAYDDAGLDAP